MVGFVGVFGYGWRSTPSTLSHALRLSNRGGTRVESFAAPPFCTAIAHSASQHSVLGPTYERVWIVYDGSPVLINGRSTPRRESMSVPIASLYRRFGPSFIDNIDGPFSLILWDANEKRLILARDRFGTRPLFYTLMPRYIAFASEVRVLLDLTRPSRVLDVDAVRDFFTLRYVPAPKTPLSAIKQVPAGSCVIADSSGSLLEESYWSQPPTRLPDASIDSCQIDLRKRLSESLGRRIVAGNTAFLLSGGVDTATLVGCAKQIVDRPLNTFTVGYSGFPAIDERENARRTAAHFGCEHVEIEVDESCIDSLKEITRETGLPVGNPAALVSRAMFSQIGKHARNVVCGDGGNELLGGSYKYDQLLHYVSNEGSAARRNLMQAAGRSLYYSLRQTTFEPSFHKLARAYFWLVGRFGQLDSDQEIDVAECARYYAALESCWTQPNLRKLSLDERMWDWEKSLRFISDRFTSDASASVLQQVPFVRATTFLPYEVMPYVDSNAARFGLESTFPYLDSELVDFLLSVPYELCYGRSYRYLMRKTFCRRPVPATVFRRSLSPFWPPMTLWSKTQRWSSFVDEQIGPDAVRGRGLFCPQVIESIVLAYRKGKAQIGTMPFGCQPVHESLWTLIAFEVWCREFLD